LQNHGYTLDARPIDSTYQDRLTPLAIVRRVFQGLGGGACVAFAAAMPWAEFSSHGVAIGTIHIPTGLLVVLGATILVGLGFFVGSIWGLVRRLPPHTRFGVIAIAAATYLSVAGLEYGYFRPDGLVAYEYRTAVRMLIYCLGIMLLACSVPEELGPRFAVFIRSRQLGWRHVLGLALLTTATGSLIGTLVLDGMPHIIDGTCYLIQARTIWSGELATQTPLHPELFAGEFMQMRISEAGYYGKYPAGWPALLGLFDTMGAAWLANAMLSGVLVLLTYAIVSDRGSKRMAWLSALLVAICPWLWFNAGTMMPHVASAAWLWLFLWLFLRGIRSTSRLYLFYAGLALGAAVLTRPADALFFALPCIAVSLGWMFHNREVWLTRLPITAAGAIPGVCAYLWINAALSGNGSTYGGEHGSILFTQMPQSIGHAFIWLHECWVGLNTQWMAGAMPVAMLLLCGVAFGRRYLRTHILAIACSASLFFCYAIFVFGGRAWVGPRWYVPLIPAIAILIAAGLNAASHTGRVRSPGGVLAAGYLRAALVAAVVVYAVVVPMRAAQLIDQPPHGIDDRIVQLTQQEGLSNAVVALPPEGLDPVTGMPNYKRGIAGMWAMSVPFEDSPVIYVSAVEGWQQMAAEAWPERSLYTMNNRAGDMTLAAVSVGANR